MKTARATTTHAMLLMATLLSSGFAHPMELSPASGRHSQHHRHNHAANNMHHKAGILDGAALRDKAISAAAVDPIEAPGFPGTLFPQGKAWSTAKAPPKNSLSQLPARQDKTAAAWILNLIELTHWAAFPLGFRVAYFIFENASSLATVLGGSTSRVFCIMLGLMCQIFGGGVSSGMMHLYEGWQVAPFRNPLESSPSGQKFPVEEFNNAWLSSVAYQTRYTFQTLGLGLFTMGVYGAKTWTKVLVGGSMAVALLGPKEPRLGLTRRVGGQKRPFLPLSLSLAMVFAINVIANLAANIRFFSPSMEEQVPFFSDGIVVSGWVCAIIPTLFIGAGGAIQAYIAETSFNQWHHLVALVSLLAGLSTSLQLYQHLVDFIKS